MSVNLWYHKHRKDFFFYQKLNGAEAPFTMEIQTKWMLETMVKLSHNSLIAMDSTFSTNKYGVSQMSIIDSTYLLKLYPFNIIHEYLFFTLCVL